MHKLTRHHVVPTSRGGANIPENIVKLRENRHRAFHIVFDNQTPTEQIKTLLAMAEGVLQPHFRNCVEQLINIEPEYVYERGVLIRRTGLVRDSR